jgi:spoIIIJ-associated protein
MSESRQFEGRSPAEAAIKACEALGVGRSEIKYDVVSDVGQGFERRVTIRISSIEAQPRPADDEQPPMRAEGSHERRSNDEHGGHRMSAQRRNSSGGRSSGGSRRPEGREARGGGDRDNRRSENRRDRGDRRPDRENDGIESLLGLDSTASQPVEHRPEVTGSLSERAQNAKKHAATMVRLMGLDLGVKVVQDDAEEVHLDLVGKDEVKAIGPKGDVLLSLQFLVNRMLGHEAEAEALVLLDAAGYRERRKNALADLATKLASRAKEEGKAVRLSPMSAHDRRVFHLTLKEVEGVSTRSEGDGLYRRLLIIPSDYA